MPPAGFEPAIRVGERPQTCSVDRSATGIGTDCLLGQYIPLRTPFSSHPLSVFCRGERPGVINRSRTRWGGNGISIPLEETGCADVD